MYILKPQEGEGDGDGAPRVARTREMIVPRTMQAHATCRARSVAAREVDFDAHRAYVRSFGCNGHNDREYGYRG